MFINMIFINNRKFNKKEGVHQVHISAANFPGAVEIVPVEI